MTNHSTPKGADSSSHDTIIIGAGQAGLALGYFLQRQARDYLVLEAAAVPGAAWLDRWDSLKLFTPARFSGLPGVAFPGDPDGHPSRDEVA
ncbi:MAG: NAD(P)-binding protein, partial [Actinomycetes bacterium]